MNPGRDLDALVAEKVMGWTNISQHFVDEDSWTGKAPNAPYGGSDIRHYSTDIAAAWEVVEKLKSHNVRIDYDINYGIDDRMGWTVSIGGVCYVQFAHTAPHAICLAALKAVGWRGDD